MDDEARTPKTKRKKKSTLLPKSANSKFYGGCGAMKNANGRYECSDP